MRLTLFEVFATRKARLEYLAYIDQNASNELKWLAWFFLRNVNKEPEIVEHFCAWWEGRTEEIEPYLSNQLFYLSGTTMEGASTDLLRSLIDYLRKESISTDLVVVPDSWEEATRGPLFGIHGFCIHNLCKEWFLGIFVTKPWLFKYMAMYLESGVFPLKSVLARYLARNREDLSLEVAEYLGLVFLTQIWRANKSYFMDERSDIPLPSPKTRFVQDLRPENRIGGENYTNSYPVRSVRVNGDAVFVEIN
ncbi:MAG: hypothetical protein A3F33_02415 [Candidatus Woykebacteria bacterium RIFCSPHIGHO2_12_FULL_43_10]|uniref:Uncharacterized protein n=1 Tax=Candidatus Woykebacteria bacterium RIFCSPHIGHO2_02_FULL_43_16b TaxID=1802601 RepID=A0A1G1WQI7_9BACT|nr:MAG: hypothetical protein A2802_00145 [Candidatus Woykebacteria bacterium RIFCSPHIGHO2_01_FULL_43_29]OGY28619.1 MAG: hypothetical protein A3F33_02415 [Candidatus Woykebacteria bacterium RIFCSPHIGHO2_12_FULL_43_10]OGY29969.1 MAG: hypothetical protein A3J50_02705 [Candidatus Woykebacteria bacterium RIFCSPHIGHO2_02_FULL_43_16b]